MDINTTSNNKQNRRRAFRIYEQVDLLYHKIETDQKVVENPDFSNMTHSLVKNNPISDTDASFTASLPDSYSLENSTLNVNISASGISFTCNEPLKPGDYLMIRILLLSSMTLIMTCSKVVYFRPSNPYENNQYPYSIGTHFINLKAEDTELLTRHIDNKKKRQRIVNGLLTCLIFFILAMPELAFELLLQACSFLLDSFLGIIHLIYELFEYSLDLTVEHVFHTGLHNTQTIVFYIMAAFGSVGIYAFLHIIPSTCQNLLTHARVFVHRKKMSLLFRWREQTSLQRTTTISLTAIAIVGYLLSFI